MARCKAIGKELVDRKYLFTRQWPLLHDTILRARFELDLMSNAFILRQFAWNGFREYILEFYQILIQRICLKTLPGLRRVPLNPSLLIEDTFVHR